MRSYYCIALIGLALTGCVNVREDVTVGATGGAVIVTHADASRWFAQVKQHMPQGMTPLQRDVDFTTRLLATPDTVETEMKLTQAPAILTFDTHASIGDMTEFDKMRDMMKQQLAGLQFMLGAMRHDTTQKHSPMEWLGKGGLVKTRWSQHEIRRTFNEALYDSLKAGHGGTPGGGVPMPMKAMMDTTATYELVFHLPMPATKVEGDPYVLSADHKTVTFERKFIDIFRDPKLLGFTIDY